MDNMKVRAMGKKLLRRPQEKFSENSCERSGVKVEQAVVDSEFVDMQGEILVSGKDHFRKGLD